MKSKNNRIFWTALGSKVLGEQSQLDLTLLPEEMQKVLHREFTLKSNGRLIRGKDLEDRKGRYIYMYSWKILRAHSFSRSFRKVVFPGIELFVPFVREHVLIIPQGFRKRVPLSLRARALIGKNMALNLIGYKLIIVAASYDEDTWKLLKDGGCCVTTPDKLFELIGELF